MKKNRMMRLASLLLVCVLLTTSVISGTYAKYVTDDSANDTARVAKWGVTVSVDGGAFATSYAKDVTTHSIATTVASSTADKLVAPGTAGTFTGVHLTGTPEVAVRITKTATVSIQNWNIDHDNDDVYDYYYCPIRITVNGTVYYGMDYANADAFAAAVKSAIELSNGDYEVGTNLATIASMNGDYGWAWNFDPSAPYTDEYDTKLGNWAANGQNAPTITLDVSCTVEQLD